MTKTFHLCQSIEGPLTHWGYQDWKGALSYIHKNDGTPFRNVEELKSAFVDELAKGHRVIPITECDNFDFERGCRGHDKP